MQKRFLVGAGPSSNTCPRCAPHCEQVTSVRIRPGWEIRSSRFAPTDDDGRNGQGGLQKRQRNKSKQEITENLELTKQKSNRKYKRKAQIQKELENRNQKRKQSH